MRKPRIIPIVISIVLSVGVLFGGWTFYKQAAVASPLSDALKAVPGVVNAEEPVIAQEQVQLKVELSKDASLKEVYGTMLKKSKEVAGSRKMELDIQASEDAELEFLWQQMMFEVAEAMETKTYSTIPKALERVTSTRDDVTAVTEMDENNVYITLRSEKGAKYIVLPRTSGTLEVWGNA